MRAGASSLGSNQLDTLTTRKSQVVKGVYILFKHHPTGPCGGVYCNIMKNHELGKLIIYWLKKDQKGGWGNLLIDVHFFI